MKRSLLSALVLALLLGCEQGQEQPPSASPVGVVVDKITTPVHSEITLQTSFGFDGKIHVSPANVDVAALYQLTLVEKGVTNSITVTSNDYAIYRVGDSYPRLENQ